MKWEKLELADELLNVKNITPAIAVNLKQNNIIKIDDIADLSRDEFKDIISQDIIDNDKKIDELIMSARDIAFNN